MTTKIGCNIGRLFTNIFAYADDMVLLAPSWRALQYLINELVSYADNIDMICNSNKTVRMVFPPSDKRKAVASAFPSFRLSGIELKFVDEYKYLGHIICNNECDDKDVLR